MNHSSLYLYRTFARFMPRLKIPRKVNNPPKVKGFKPYGVISEGEKLDPVILNYEEYEALKMCDYDMYNHHQASIMMNVSRPTYTRIYASARMKIAKAFVEGRKIEIEGGKVYFDSNWFYCKSCGCHFNNPEINTSVSACPLCGSSEIEQHFEDTTTSQENINDDMCVCPKCGYTKKHMRGVPCRNERCPSCNTPLVRQNP
ncbi:MAG: DUF134 domain-containing protein [Bacteroidales bacterium]|nr:DUF134 domain-containing protein [Bacteroidales bacterium]